MKNHVSKYLTPFIALMLILSNFSFASHLMLCGMSEDIQVCQCSHNNTQQTDGLSISKERSKCCTDVVTELSNSNLLTTVRMELPVNINLFSAIVLNLNQNILLQNNPDLLIGTDNSHLPLPDVPIQNSSLLI